VSRFCTRHADCCIRYRDAGGVELIVQTTGDVPTPRIVRELLDLNVNIISVSGIDAFHTGLETASAREALTEN
jgi:hypothetical protein